MIDEALKILNWTQKDFDEVWLIKLKYIRREGSERYNQPMSKTSLRSIETPELDLVVRLCAMLDETLNHRAKSNIRLYDATIKLDDEVIIEAKDNTPAKVLGFIGSQIGPKHGSLALSLATNSWGANPSLLQFYSSYKEMCESNSSPKGIMLLIKKAKVK
jgi:hypothetical protein